MHKRPSAISLGRHHKIHSFAPDTALDRWSGSAPRALGMGDNVITMFDVIGEDYWTGGGVTAAKVASQLRAIGDRDIEIHVNSPGGDMFEGIAIYNILREHPANVTVKVMGLAASAASVIAMAGDRLEIGRASFLMIHNCWVIAIGNRHDMIATAALLEPFDAAMADVYAARSGQDLPAIAAMMDAETWIGGAAAVDFGLADALLEADAEPVVDDAGAGSPENALRRAEAGLCQAMPRSRARALLKEIKGMPGAAQDGSKPGAASDASGEAEALAAVRALLKNLTT